MRFIVYVLQKEEMASGELVDDWIHKGDRKSLGAATSLAEKHIGKIYGYQKRGNEYTCAGHDLYGQPNQKKAKIIQRNY